VEVRALSPGENARDRPADTRVASVDPDTGLPPGVRVATGKAQPMPGSAMDTLVSGLPAATPAATIVAAAVAPGPGGGAAPAGAPDWRFDMHQDGRAMTADEFDAWMKSRRARVATGR